MSRELGIPDAPARQNSLGTVDHPGRKAVDPAGISVNAPDPLSEGRNFNKRDVILAVGGILALGETVLGLPGCSPGGATGSGNPERGNPSQAATATAMAGELQGTAQAKVTETAAAEAPKTPTASPTPEKASTIEDVIAQLDAAEQALLNPDPALMAKYGITKERMQQEQTIVVWGGIKGGEKAFSDDSLEGIKKSLSSKNNLTAAEKKDLMTKLEQVFKSLTSPMSSSDGSKGDYAQWKKEDIVKYDPNNILVPSRALVYPISLIKQKAAMATIQSAYALSNLPTSK